MKTNQFKNHSILHVSHFLSRVHVKFPKTVYIWGYIGYRINQLKEKTLKTIIIKLNYGFLETFF